MVLGRGGHSVDPSGPVDVPDAVVGPAQVGVRDLDAVPEVELDAGLQRVPLRTGGETRAPSLPLRVISVAEVRSSRRRSARTATSCNICHKHSAAEYERMETEIEL